MKHDLLHRFARSLDKGEVRVCKQHLQHDDSPVGIMRQHMFDTLLRQNEYDHEGLLRSLRKNGCDPTRLSQEKHWVFDSLIEVVGRLHREREERQCPYTHWQDARTLLRLGMAEEAADMVKAGIAHATALEDIFAELQLRELLREVLKLMDRKAHQPAIIDNDQRLETTVAKARELTAYTLIHDRMLDYLKRYRVAEAEAVRREIDEMMRQPLMRNPGQASSLPAQLRYFGIRTMYCNLCNDHRGSLEAQRHVVRLWESNAPRREREPHIYRKALANLIGMLTMAGRSEEARQMLARMAAIPLRYQRDRAMHFCDMELQHLTFYMNTGALEEALGREQLIVSGLHEFGRHISSSYHVTFRYNLAVCHLLNDGPGHARRLFNEIRELRDCHERQDIQGLARLFHLALMLQDDSFESFLRNSRPFFNKDDRQYALEQTVYEWMAQHWKLTDDEAIRASFARLTEQLRIIDQQRVTGAEEFRMWAQAHAEGVPVKEVYVRGFAG